MIVKVKREEKDTKNFMGLELKLGDGLPGGKKQFVTLMEKLAKDNGFTYSPVTLDHTPFKTSTNSRKTPIGGKGKIVLSCGCYTRVSTEVYITYIFRMDDGSGCEKEFCVFKLDVLCKKAESYKETVPIATVKPDGLVHVNKTQEKQGEEEKQEETICDKIDGDILEIKEKGETASDHEQLSE